MTDAGAPAATGGGSRPALLALENVDVAFDGVIQVLHSVNLEVPEGRVVALLGANGAGKTTALKAISSLLAPERGRVTAGRILLDGEDVANADPGEVVRRGVVQVLEGRRVLAHLTVEQNLRVGAHLRDGVDLDGEVEAVLALLPQLRLLLKRTAGYVSGGEMQMMLLGRALMARPRLLLLDEPSMGLAPAVTRQLFQAIRRINAEQGVSILLVEQNAVAAIALCDHGYVMENGRIVLHGDRARLESNEDVREFYLGLAIGRERRSFREVKHYKRRKRWLG